MSIQSFRCADTEALYRGVRVARWVNIERAALRKLTQLAVSPRLEDLRIPPGNRLELLRGDRAGQYSTASALMISGGSVFFGLMMVPMMWKSSITTKGV